MLKILAIIVLCIFFFRTVGFFVRLLFGGTIANKTNTGYQTNRRKSSNGNLHVDRGPNQSKKKKDFKGGEYVDFEDLD